MAVNSAGQMHEIWPKFNQMSCLCLEDDCCMLSF